MLILQFIKIRYIYNWVINLKKIVFLCFLIALLSIGIAFSHTEDVFKEAEQLIESKIPCSELTEEQLEHIGDYYMEQMHPGEAHEVMDERMGGEGSESLKQMHIAIAKRLYCNDISGMANYGMMDMMMGGGMMSMAMGSGMMGNFGYGMMGNSSYGSGYWSFLNILSLLLLIGLVALVYLWIIKLWRDIKTKSKKK